MLKGLEKTALILPLALTALESSFKVLGGFACKAFQH